MSIAPLARSIRDYISIFNLVALALYRHGRVILTKDPAGAAMAWWVKADQAGAVKKLARKTGDVPGAARSLGIVLTEHGVVAQRAKAAVARIEQRLRQAHGNGDLRFFNRAYRQRREAARAEGRGFMSYTVARSRLQKALAATAAGETTSLVTRVFGT